jgi:uncharacterized protein (TIGR03084 family)
VVDDLNAEQQGLDSLVAPLDERGWLEPTPAEGWNINDQIAHLAFFDEKARLAVADPAGFMADLAETLPTIGDHLAAGRAMSGEEVLELWRRACRTELTAFRSVDADSRVPWYGPPMRATSFVAARLMETWAHGRDVADALGHSLAIPSQERVLPPPPTDRLFHIAELGVRTFSWSFTNRGLEVPTQRVRVELVAPSGANWVWNDAETESVIGPAEAFCLVVTQRRHFLDTELRTDGPTARRWMEIAQCFAGPPGPGRPPTPNGRGR